MSWQRALVTGASTGIGREAAKQLAKRGVSLVLVARDGERLEQLASEVLVPVEIIVADLTQPVDLERVANRLEDHDAPIDLLVNNAGKGAGERFVEADIEELASVVSLNVVALQRLAHAAAGAMAKRGYGAILNVSSVAGFWAGPGSVTYSATKAFVTNFSRSLRLEMAARNVSVTALCPGLTRTEFQDRADINVDGVPAFLWQNADVVVAAGLTALENNKPVVVSGRINRVAVAGLTLLSALPGSIVDRVVTLIYRNRD